MSLLKNILLGAPVAPAEAASYVPEPGTRFEGAAVFSEGFYYPILNDEHSREIGPDRSQPLVWTVDAGAPKGGYLVHAAPADPNHFHTYGLNPVELVPEGPMHVNEEA